MQRLLEGIVRVGETDRVFVLTAAGELIALPAGSTPLDFAFHIHTRLGYRATDALINGKREPLTYELRHGDRVEILIDPQRDLPPAEWLERPEFLHTARARKAVQQALEAARRADAIAFGREIVEEELSRVDGETNVLPRLLKALGFQREEKLFEAAGRGEVARREIAYTVDVLAGNAEGDGRVRAANAALDASDTWAPIVAGDADGLRPRYARCCRPQPGDPIRGYRSGQSVVVHHASCPVGSAEAETHQPVEVRWPAPRRTGTVLIRVRGRKGRTIAPAIRRAAEAAGIEVVDLASSRAVEGEITLTLECRASEQGVQPLLERLRRLAGVSSVDVVVQAGA
jgi:GTP pyrophosphokinase